MKELTPLHQDQETTGGHLVRPQLLLQWNRL